MGTDEVIRKTLALAQSQLSNYKTIDSRRENISSSQTGGANSNTRQVSQSVAAATQQRSKRG